MKRGLRIGALAGVMLLIDGCASWLPPSWQDSATPPPTAIEVLQALPTWQLRGRVAVRSADDAWSADLIWRHAVDGEHVDFNGPFAQRAASLHYRPGWIELSTADGARQTSEQPAVLLAEQLGWSIPLDALRYWVLAAPQPGLAAQSTPEPYGFDQAGWALRYENPQAYGAWVLPRKMTARSGAVVLKLVIDDWKVGE